MGAFPYLIAGDFDPSDYKYAINVSDEHDGGIAQKITQAGAIYCWFPMNERRKDIGFNCIYGAIMMLHQAELECAPVYLHCMAGKNRSRIVQQCYHYARCGHFYTDACARDGQLLDACARGLLPPIGEMRRFLSKLGWHISKSDTIINY